MRAANEQVDLLFADLARQVAAAVARHAEQTADGPRITPLARVRILAEVDRALDAVFPSRPGEASALEDLILEATASARQAAVRRQARLLERFLARVPGLLERLRGDLTA